MPDKKVIALKCKYQESYFLLPLPNDNIMIMELKEDGTWDIRKGACAWGLMQKSPFFEPLYKLVVD